MSLTVRVVIEDPSQVGEARRIARKCAVEAGLSEEETEQVAIVATEAATNILKHAGRGEILINPTLSGQGQGQPGVEILALDRGAGMANLARCMADGYSTAGSAGQGLGAISRQSTDTDIFSVAGKGTALLARWAVSSRSPAQQPAAFLTGAVNVPKPGQVVCGDAWGVVQSNGHTTFLLADGLGHGLEASLASQDAVRVLREHPGLAPKDLLSYVHSALRGSRGAAVAVAQVDPERGVVVFSGVGNIAAQIYGGSKINQRLVSVNGTAGHQVHQMREFSYPWSRNGLLVMYSDGLGSSTSLEAQPAAALHDPTLIAGFLYREFSRGTDDATVLVAREIRDGGKEVS